MIRNGTLKFTAAALIVVGLSVGATAAHAATSNFGAKSCSGGSRIYIATSTTGATSHTVWTSSSNYTGQSWAGTSVYQGRTHFSTKTISNANYATYTLIRAGAAGCYVDL